MMVRTVLLVPLLASVVLQGASAARTTRKSNRMTVLEPQNKGLRAVGVVMNPGGLVPFNLYTEHMKRWQAEAEKAGISLWTSTLSYWFDLPLPIRFKQNYKNAVRDMQAAGLPENAELVLTGHSMGGGVVLDAAIDLYNEGMLNTMVLQAAYITRKFFPPIAAEFNYPVPTLTIAAELNFGSARITRMTEAFYKQVGHEDKHPVVLVEGMNHMQFASGYDKEDLAPEIDEVSAQEKVSRLAVNFISKNMGLASSELLTAEMANAYKIMSPFIKASELAGSKEFNVPNQWGVPGKKCPRDVCPTSSDWVNRAQAHIAGDDVMATGAAVKNNFANLNPWDFGDREDRKPFIDGKVMQAYLQSNKISEKDFKDDVDGFRTAESLAVKFISRQYAALHFLEKDIPKDGDVCVELNKMAYEYALANAPAKTRARYEKFGQKFVFAASKYEVAGPLWAGGQLRWREVSAGLELRSQALFTPPGNKAIDGNHYCQLLSPARAMEWLYVDGLKKSLFNKPSDRATEPRF